MNFTIFKFENNLQFNNSLMIINMLIPMFSLPLVYFNKKSLELNNWLCLILVVNLYFYLYFKDYDSIYEFLFSNYLNKFLGFLHLLLQ